MQKKSVLRNAWLAMSVLLLVLPVFLPSTSAFYDVIGVCVTIAIILSYPLNLLFGWLLFGTGLVDGSIGSMYLMLFLFLLTGYVQWFVLVPRLVRFVKQNFFRKDLQISLNGIVPNVKTLPEAQQQPDLTAQDWQQKWYDLKKRTPVERLFDKEND